MPLHFCYFFSQTQSANGATELARAQALGKRIKSTSAESATEHGNANFPSKATTGKLKETKNFCWWAREREISHTKTRRHEDFLGALLRQRRRAGTGTKKEFKSTCSRLLAKENEEVFLLFELRK